MQLFTLQVALFPTAVDVRIELARASERCFPDVAYRHYASALALLKVRSATPCA
jgi:hypothetical protein